MQPGDQQVLDYIATHEGTISLSQAAQDLSMSPGALGLTIERLKAAGFLKPA
jgi:DNA-binding MarR family transcriptional regulator